VAQYALGLLDQLIGCWHRWDRYADYYLRELAPAIARGQHIPAPGDADRRIVERLKELLTANEWERLPQLLEQRRAGTLLELESDRRRRQEEADYQRRRADERARVEALEEQRRITEENQRRQLGIRRAGVLRQLREQLSNGFLSADSYFDTIADAGLVSREQYQDLKTQHVRSWARSCLEQELDEEQAAAVGVCEGDALVVARAGSGKTRTLVARAAFLQRHCGVPPSELLLLAFNRRAAGEMRQRLSDSSGEGLPHIMTFHSLAWALVHPREQLIYDDVPADQLGLSREVQEVVDEHIRSAIWGNRIKQLMLSHFRDDWERIEHGRFHVSMDEFLAYRRCLPRETLKGDFVKSLGERLIANALFEHDVDYKYEWSFGWNGTTYRPDFTVFTGQQRGVVIEYFGLEGTSDYDEMSERKRRFWDRKSDWVLLELSQHDLARLGEDGFRARLILRLREAGLRCELLPEEEIWSRIRERAVDSFTRVVNDAISRCRMRNLSPEDLRGLMRVHRMCSSAEEGFLAVAVSIYEGYLERLAACGKEDFNGLMWRAVKLIRDGQTRFIRDRGLERGDLAKLRFVMVDEYQDFSEMFWQLLSAIRLRNKGVRILCVGDDWQAINGFAGSDLCFFRDFSGYFAGSSRHQIRTNYRSAKRIVDAGNALMLGRGDAAVASSHDDGEVVVYRLDQYAPTAAEQSRNGADVITPALVRIARLHLDRGRDVAVLCRTNHVPWYVSYAEQHLHLPDGLERFQEHLRALLPNDDRGRLKVSTTHRFKGLEEHAILVVDALERRYPLVHPNWVFLRLFGDSLERIVEEERRLFYVALTRASESLTVVTETGRETPFLDAIRSHASLKEGDWSALPPVPHLSGALLEVRVYHAYAVRSVLKRLGYTWVNDGKYWRRCVLAEGFSLDDLLSQPWATSQVAVSVYSETGELLHRK